MRSPLRPRWLQPWLNLLRQAERMLLHKHAGVCRAQLDTLDIVQQLSLTFHPIKSATKPFHSSGSAALLLPLWSIRVL